MKIRTYLCAKYGTTTPTTITGKEAILFGIPFPIQSGWQQAHGDREIDAQTAAKLVNILKGQASSPRATKAQFAARGLLDLENAYGTAEVPFSEKEARALKQELKRKRKRENRRLRKENSALTPVLVAAPRREFVMTDEFLSSYEWRKVRMQVLKRDGARCRCCGASPATGAVMNVDHIKPRRIYPELALSVDNLQVLCNECNHGKGNWDMTDWRQSGEAEIQHMRSIKEEGTP